AGTRADVALDTAWIDLADRHEPVDRLDRVDGVAAGDGDPGFRADGLAAFENSADRIDGQPVDWHAHQGQREQGRAAHRVNIGQRVGRGDGAEVVGIVDDRHEEVG